MWYEGVLAGTALLALALHLSTRTRNASAPRSPEFVSFQRNYLLVSVLAMFADWLKGPYLYALYAETYGFDKGSIAQLFICGFVSSMIVGSFVGSLADRLGRRRLCLTYAVVYSLSAITKLSSDFGVLMLGRFFGGISTSLLFSVFETWMVCEHNRRGFSAELLGETFGLATLLNGMAAVFAGLVANLIAKWYGNVGPFVFAIVPLAVLYAIVFTTWSENFGDSSGGWGSGFSSGLGVVMGNPKVLALGLGQACFESAMYTFVYMWTPALDPTLDRHLPLGIIFSNFMLCIMCGSFVFTLLVRVWSLERIPFVVHVLAAASTGAVASFGYSEEIVFGSFLVFELMCGIYFPTYAILRSKVIPEDVRSSVMNVCRIPLNAFVILLLMKVKYWPTDMVFYACMVAHVGSLAMCFRIYSLSSDRDRHANKGSVPLQKV